MANPLLYGGSQPNAATNPTAGVNSTSPAVARQKNTFMMPQQVLQTERFSDIMPFFVMDCVPNDDVRLKVDTDLRAATFASPIMSQITKHRAYVAVPKSVIFPRLWSKMFVNPKKGDDVTFENVQAAVNFYNVQQRLLYLFQNTNAAYDYFKLMRLVWELWSPYGLLPYLGLNVFPAKSGYQTFVTLVESQFRGTTQFGENGKLMFRITGARGDTNVIERWFSIANANGWIGHGIDSAFQFFDQLSSLDVSAQIYLQSATGTATLIKDVSTISDFIGGFARAMTILSTNLPTNRLVNIQRLVAYQMACSQFFTSDDVDDVYTSDLWYQNLNGLVNSLANSRSSGFFSFTYNGIDVMYEPYSYYTVSEVLSSIDGPSHSYCVDYFLALFTPQSSLRYGDYFNAARLTPLAVGDVTAPVETSSVNAVDITRSILSARYLNVVNCVRNTIRGYAAAVWGVIPDDVPIEPKFVSHSSDVLVGTIVANTSGDQESGQNQQGTLNTNISLHSSHNEFSSHFNQDTILIGLTWYDALIAYPAPTEPFAFKIDRFDDFQPMLQNIGDQPIDMCCLLSSSEGYDGNFEDGTIFGYLQNDAEYKQSISRALGGYIDGSLPTWAYVRQFQEWMFGSGEGYLPGSTMLSSYFIRSNYGEFDVFFKSLTGVGSSYFHFEVSYVNEILASRPMEYVSGILFQNK